jgi:hypothetical protein
MGSLGTSKIWQPWPSSSTAFESSLIFNQSAAAVHDIFIQGDQMSL